MTTHSHDCFDEGVVGLGPMPSDVCLIGIAPGRDEWLRSKRPFSGQSGRLMNGILKYVGLNRADVFTTNMYCRWNDSPSDAQIRECMPRLIEELHTAKPKVIVTLGKIVTPYFVPGKWADINGGAWWSEDFNCWVIPTYHPAAYLYQDAGVDIADAVRDFRKITYYIDKPRDFGEIKHGVNVARNLDEVNNMFHHFSNFVRHPLSETRQARLHEPNDICAVDIETTYEHDEIISLAFTCSHGTYHVPRALVYGPDYSILAGSPVRWTYHNGMFDSPEILKHLHVDMPIHEDTLLMSYSLDERGGRVEEVSSGGQEHGVGIHGLKDLAMEYCGAGRYADRVKGQRPQDMSPADLAYYNGHDAHYTYMLAQYFEPRQRDDGVRGFYQDLLIQGANVHSKITAEGAHIDTHELNVLKMEWIPRWLELEEQLCNQATIFGWPADERINLQSPKQLNKLIYDMMDAPLIYRKKHEKSFSKSTAMAVLKSFAAGLPEGKVPVTVSEFSAGLLEVRGLAKDIQTYISGIEDDMDANHLIHPEPDLHGTRNGRLAYKKPPIMTIPKPRTVGADRARIRRIFKPREGYCLMEADFSQAELWAAYFVSGDEALLEDLLSGDFHASGAQRVFQVDKTTLDPIRWELYRDSFKIVAYGFLYGAREDALVGDKSLTGRGSSGSYILMSTKAQAKDVLNKFEARYTKLVAWREAEKTKVRVDGEQANLNGRKRRYHMITNMNQMNQTVNFPISSLSHDHLMKAWIDLFPLLGEFDSRIWFEIHDSIVMEVSKRYIQEVAHLTKRVMEAPKFGLERGIPVDIKVGDNWYELEKLESYIARNSVVA